MESLNHQMSLPTTLEVKNYGCAVAEIHGKCFPYPDVPLFLCVDFVEESTVGEKMIPVLRRLNIKQNPKSLDGIINKVFHKMLWLPINRNPLHELRIYISDDKGNIRSFDRCHLSCTLVCIPDTSKI